MGLLVKSKMGQTARQKPQREHWVIAFRRFSSNSSWLAIVSSSCGKKNCHCEKRQRQSNPLDCFTSLAMTLHSLNDRVPFYQGS
jgi:hypothetical protein